VFEGVRSPDPWVPPRIILGFSDWGGREPGCLGLPHDYIGVQGIGGGQEPGRLCSPPSLYRGSVTGGGREPRRLGPPQDYIGVQGIGGVGSLDPWVPYVGL